MGGTAYSRAMYRHNRMRSRQHHFRECGRTQSGKSGLYNHWKDSYYDLTVHPTWPCFSGHHTSGDRRRAMKTKKEIPIGHELLLVFLQVRDYCHDISISDIQRFERELLAYVETNQPELLIRLAGGRYLSPETVELARKTVLDFKQQTFVSSRQKRKEKTDKILGLLHVAPRPRAPVKVA